MTTVPVTPGRASASERHSFVSLLVTPGALHEEERGWRVSRPPAARQRRSERGEGWAMSKVETDTRSETRSAVRCGRPPRALAGEVDARILDAARRVFLERGLAGASIDEIAGLACAGKPTIYARFPGKEELFTAVMMRKVDANIARVESQTPTGTTIKDRLANLGASV